MIGFSSGECISGDGWVKIEYDKVNEFYYTCELISHISKECK